VIEVLAAQSAPVSADADPLPPAEPGLGIPNADLQRLLAGLGDCSAERLGPADPCIGRSLAQLNLRGLTGATVLAIQRPGEGVDAPTAKQILHSGDVLVLAGSAESVKRARRLLHDLLPARGPSSGTTPAAPSE
jgi:CPA2 family monovalent cation:H+ antiporter-2